MAAGCSAHAKPIEFDRLSRWSRRLYRAIDYQWSLCLSTSFVRASRNAVGLRQRLLFNFGFYRRRVFYQLKAGKGAFEIHCIDCLATERRRSDATLRTEREALEHGSRILAHDRRLSALSLVFDEAVMKSSPR